MEEEVKDPAAVLAELRRVQGDLKDAKAEIKQLKKETESNDYEVWKERALKSEAKVALSEQGIKDPDRILKYLNLDGIEVNEDGITGLDKKLEEVKADFPELFDAKRRAGGKADIFADNPAQTPKSASERQAQALMG